jgi:hypothetical protein
MMMTATERQAAEQAAKLADDTILFAGRTRGATMHLIAGKAKRQSSTESICGQRVGNTYRTPSQYEKVCKLCQRGDRRAAFTSQNQPRDCGVCGRRYADSVRRDNGDQTCPDCYEAAGLENEHLDGGHKGKAVEGCPRCAEVEQAPTPTPTKADAEKAMLQAHQEDLLAAIQALGRMRDGAGSDEQRKRLNDLLLHVVEVVGTISE